MTETAAVQALVPRALSLGGPVTKDTFLVELPSAQFVHLACHGVSDAKDVLHSGFVFHDGMVELSALMNVTVENGCFAFLSACESAMGDKDLPDENMHLAAAMMFMGYRSVIGTLW